MRLPVEVPASYDLSVDRLSGPCGIETTGGDMTDKLGVIFYLVKQIPFNHAIRHRLAVGGNDCDYVAIYHATSHGQLRQ
jgi:hemolysin III